MSDVTLDYVGVVRQLPRPNLAQSERFARYVSSAHSWYKHLPIDPKVPFVFYLDPAAGMNHIRTRTGETALVEITDESNRFHYTWQKTQDYRRRFGYWNYHAPYGTSFIYAGDGAVVSTAGEGLKILAESGDWVSVPPDIAKKGTAFLSALVHPLPNVSIWESNPARFGLSMIPELDDAPQKTVMGRMSSVLRKVRYVLQQSHRANRDLSELDELIPGQAMELIQRTVADRYASVEDILPGEKSWDWPDESWLEQLQELGIEARRLSAVVKYVQLERALKLATKVIYRSSHESPDVFCDIVKERIGQLGAMTDAMGRFVDVVFCA